MESHQNDALIQYPVCLVLLVCSLQGDDDDDEEDSEANISPAASPAAPAALPAAAADVGLSGAAAASAQSAKPAAAGGDSEPVPAEQAPPAPADTAPRSAKPSDRQWEDVRYGFPCTVNVVACSLVSVPAHIVS